MGRECAEGAAITAAPGCGGLCLTIHVLYPIPARPCTCTAQVWVLQAKALVAEGATDAGPRTWLLFQYHVWQLLKLDAARRLEEATVGRAHLAPGVPHVDTGAGVGDTGPAAAGVAASSPAPSSGGKVCVRP